MVQEALKKIGLTGGEIKVYLSLLELGASSTGAIIKKSKISGSKVYEVLNRLAEKGLVNTTIKNNVKYFEASSPERILEYLKEKKKEIDTEEQEIHKIMPKLILKQKNTLKSEVKIYTGWEGMKTVEQEIIDTLKKGEEWLDMGLTTQPKSWEIYFTKKQKERGKKGIIHRGLINIQYKDLNEERKKIPHTYYKFLPKDFAMPISISIYKNKVAIWILLLEAPTTIVIESEPVAISFRKYFELLWKTAKK